MDDLKPRVSMLDGSVEIAYEFELLPIARAMIGQQVKEAKKIRPSWAMRPESVKAYTLLQKTPDDQLMMAFSEMRITDPYLQGAIKNLYDESYTTKEIGEWMHKEWVKRTEQYWITRLLQTDVSKEKMACAAAIRGLYHESTPEAYIVDMANPSPPEDFLMTYQGVSYRPRGDISVVKAKAKSGKSSFLKIEIAAMISPSGVVNGMSRSCITGTDNIREPYNVLWVDTEQSFASSDKSYRQVLQMAGLPTDQNPPNLKLVNLRMMDSQNRLNCLEEETTLAQWDVVILDGVKDVVKNINDPIETDNTMARLLQLIQDTKVAFITVIHENPSDDTDKMRGWLGTELGNKAFEVQEVKLNKDTDTFIVTNTERREKTIPAYGFKFDDNDQLIQSEAIGSAGPGPQPLTREEKQWNQFIKAFEDNLDMSHTQEEIIERLLVVGMSETTIKRRVALYKAKKWISADETDGVTRYGLSIEQKTKIKSRLNGEDEAPIIDPNNPIWNNETNNNDTPPF